MFPKLLRKCNISSIFIIFTLQDYIANTSLNGSSDLRFYVNTKGKIVFPLEKGVFIIHITAIYEKYTNVLKCASPLVVCIN